MSCPGILKRRLIDSGSGYQKPALPCDGFKIEFEVARHWRILDYPGRRAAAEAAIQDEENTLRSRCFESSSQFVHGNERFGLPGNRIMGSQSMIPTSVAGD
jgi:hypothetical protein